MMKQPINSELIVRLASMLYYGTTGIGGLCLDLISVKCFLAVANLLNFTKAANSLFITQPTLSRHISSLESEIGKSLFFRNNRSVSLTHEGKLLLEPAKELIKRYDAFLSAVAGLSANIIGTIQIGYYEMLGFDVLYDVMARFKDTHPQVSISAVLTEKNDAVQLVNQGKLDAAIISKIHLQSYPQLKYDYLADNKLICIMPHGHPLEEKESLSLDDFHDIPIILPARTITAPEYLDWLYAEFNSRHVIPKISGQFNGYSSMILMVRGGYGAAIVSAGIGPKNIRQDGLAARNIDLDTKDLDVVFAWKDEKNSLLQAFREELHKQPSIK